MLIRFSIGSPSAIVSALIQRESCLFRQSHLLKVFRELSETILNTAGHPTCVDHTFSDDCIEFRISPFIWELSADYAINIFSCPRFGIFLKGHQEMSMRQTSFLKLKCLSYGFDWSKYLSFLDVFDESL